MSLNCVLEGFLKKINESRRFSESYTYIAFVLSELYQGGYVLLGKQIFFLAFVTISPQCDLAV